MSNKRLDELFPLDARDPIRKTTRQFLAAIEARLAALELERLTYEQGVDSARAVAIARIDEVITPLLAAISDITNLFTATSHSSLTVALGAIQFTIDESARATFVVLDYMLLRAQAAIDAVMNGRVINFDRATGVVSLDVIYIGHVTGSYSAWDCQVSVITDEEHAHRTDNPHATTAAQVGAYTTAQADAATSAAVNTAISNLVNAAPTALDTLKELADALGDDANFATTVNVALGNRLRFDAAQTLTAGQQTQGQTNLGGTNVGKSLFAAASAAAARGIIVAHPLLPMIGQCYLSLNGANLILNPKDGNQLIINGAVQTLPDAGVTLSPVGNIASALYYIYAYWTGSAIALEYSTTAYVMNPGGYRFKSGDPTRTLVGMWASGATNGTWSTNKCEGISLFNPQPKFAHSGSLNPTTTSNGFVEMTASMRVPFITFAERPVFASLRGRLNVNNNADSAVVEIALDNSTPLLSALEGTSLILSPYYSSGWQFWTHGVWNTYSEARHFITAWHRVTTAGVVVSNYDTDLCVQMFG